jgi:hypothetical protein
LLQTQDDRLQVIKDIKSQENKDRKVKSLRQFEVYRGNLYTYVYNYLSRQFSASTLKEIPIVASINIANRVVDQEASIYDREPKREFLGLSDDQKSAIESIYESMEANVKLAFSNAMFKLQDQNTLMVIPKNGDINIRVLKNHQVDVIPNADNPEIADAYIISSLDKNDSQFNAIAGSNYNEQGTYTQRGDGINQSIGDPDDYQATLERYLVWTKTEHFFMNGYGEVIGNVEPNPIGMLPFIDISAEKDFEFWVRAASTVVDFCIEYNSALSMQNQVIKMQGFSQMWISGTKETMPENIQVGPNFILKLIKGKDVDGNAVDTEVGFASPTPDLSGTKAHLEMLLANFLSSKGVTTGLVTSGKTDTYSSGMERMLAQIEQFSASRSDFAIYRSVEEQLFELVKAWHNLAVNVDGLLEPEYVSTLISDEAEVNVCFEGPELIKSEKEVVELAQLKEELGVASKVDSIMAIYDLDRDAAKLKLKEIEEDNGGSVEPIPSKDTQEGQSPVGSDGAGGLAEVDEGTDRPGDN